MVFVLASSSEGFQVILSALSFGFNCKSKAPVSLLVNADDTSVVEINYITLKKLNEIMSLPDHVTRNNHSCPKMIVNVFPTH